MIQLILIVFMLIKIHAPTWCYILAATDVIAKAINLGIKVGEKASER